MAYPYLVQHVSDCPLAPPDTEVVAVEEDVRGFDHDAQVVPVCRPDLMYRRSETLVMREVKTSEMPFGNGRDEAFDKYLQIPFSLRMLVTGLAAAHHCSAGAVELELLTPTGRFVWSWSTTDEVDVELAAAEVEHVVDAWHHDSEWVTRPGAQCGWCPVRRWCPDRDRWQAGPTGATADVWPSPSLPGADEDEPPF